jgi:two-component system response regulator NreC
VNVRDEDTAADAHDIRVVVADRHDAILRCIEAALTRTSDIEVVATAATAANVIASTERYEPDVLVLDYSTAIDSTGRVDSTVVASHGHRVPILLLTAETDGDPRLAAAAVGATRWLSKYSTDDQLVAAVRGTARLCREGSPSCIDAPPIDHATLALLGTREREVFAFLARGYTAAQIGAQLHISARTVYTYKARIRQKIGVSHRAGFVQAGLRLGLLDAPAAD